MRIILYHNPGCSTSRKVLAALTEAGRAPQVIEYLKNPPTLAELNNLLKEMGMQPREILRKSGGLYASLGLDDPALSDTDILAAIDQHPVLMQRPILVTDMGTRLCRPVEKMQEILPQ